MHSTRKKNGFDKIAYCNNDIKQNGKTLKHGNNYVKVQNTGAKAIWKYRGITELAKFNRKVGIQLQEALTVKENQLKPLALGFCRELTKESQQNEKKR